MKNLLRHQNLFLIFGIFGVMVSPWLFTHPCLFGWKSFDFSQTGSIGDTIGGITAPIVGIVSILLLWWTLKEQMKFNKKQAEINDEQRKFNDASRIISLQSQVLLTDENIKFCYSCSGRTYQGEGVASLQYLRKGLKTNVAIPYEELTDLIEKIHILEMAVCSLVDTIEKSSLDETDKISTLSTAKVYIDAIKLFFEMLDQDNIDYILPLESEHGEFNKKGSISEKIGRYNSYLLNRLDIVNKYLNHGNNPAGRQ